MHDEHAFLSWRPEYAIGQPEVDTEHRDIIRLINALYESYLAQDSPAELSSFLGETYAWIHAHFALEERLMRDIAYEGYREHKAEHEVLLEEIGAVIRAIDAGQPFDAARFANVLSSWFSDHFRTQDARLHSRFG